MLLKLEKLTNIDIFSIRMTYTRFTGSFHLLIKDKKILNLRKLKLVLFKWISFLWNINRRLEVHCPLNEHHGHFNNLGLYFSSFLLHFSLYPDELAPGSFLLSICPSATSSYMWLPQVTSMCTISNYRQIH